MSEQATKPFSGERAREIKSFVVSWYLLQYAFFLPHLPQRQEL